jgi:hypothetical protein
VPYNLFRLFLVHKISIYVYILKKERGKRKRKGFPQLAGPGGGFRPSRVRARAGRQPTRPASGERRGDSAVGVGPRARGRGADGVEWVTGGNRPGLDRR